MYRETVRPALETAPPQEPGGSGPASCPGHQLLARLSERWATLVVEALAEEPRRHSDLRRALPGVTQKMLTQTVRGLERDGLVRRSLHDTRPVGVSYSLTPLGQQLFLLQRQIYTWAVEHMGEIQQAQVTFDAELRAGGRPSVLDLNRGVPPGE